MMRLPPTGLFFDIDGTLAPIIADPDAVTITSAARGALDTLASRAIVVMLTGRDVAAARRIVGLDSVIYAGNHGAEWWEGGTVSILPAAQPYVEAVHAIAERAVRELAGVEGLYVEDKGPTLSIHYRRARDEAVARSAVLTFLAAAAGEAGLVVREGKMVAELRLPIAIDKGTAVREVVARKGLRSAAAFGDDLTDVDALLAIRELRGGGGFDGVTVAVGGASAPVEVVAAADHVVPGHEALEALISQLAES
jgi:trehalose 6-phosphate phosphatase